MAVATGMSSEEFVEAWTTKASKNRLKGLDWDELQLNTLLVDPPRVRCLFPLHMHDDVSGAAGRRVFEGLHTRHAVFYHSKMATLETETVDVVQAVMLCRRDWTKPQPS